MLNFKFNYGCLRDVISKFSALAKVENKSLACLHKYSRQGNF